MMAASASSSCRPTRRSARLPSALPPHKFVRQVKGDKVIYVYADPTICVCLYVGGQKAYGIDRPASSTSRIADEQAQAAADIT